MTDYRIGQLALGAIPRVVGTLTSRESLPSAYPTGDYACDVVEVRLDEIDSNACEWVKESLAIEAAGFPVVLTLRLASEGGKWRAPDAQRLPILSAALDRLTCIDVEWQSELCVPLCRQAQELGKNIIVSYHNFEQTPVFGELKGVLDRIMDIPCAIPKISTMVTGEGDVRTLIRLLETAHSRPACMIGMGSKGTKSRVVLPCLGSCLAYGYHDSPSAPGQLSASTLVEFMGQLLPEYHQDVMLRKDIMACA